MGRLGHQQGSALHRWWRDHDKPKVDGVHKYEHSKIMYEKRKEMKLLEKQVKQLEEEKRLKLREAAQLRKEKEAQREAKDASNSTQVNAKKVKKMTKKQMIKQGIKKFLIYHSKYVSIEYCFYGGSSYSYSCRNALLVVNNQTGEALYGIKVKLNIFSQDIELTTNKTGFITYVYKAVTPKKIIISIAPQLDFSGFPSKQCFEYQQARLQPKNLAQELIQINVLDQISQNPLIATCYISISNNSITFGSNSLGVFILTPTQVRVTDTISVQVRWTLFWEPYNNITVRITNSTNFTILVPRRNTEYTIFGIILVDKKTYKRIPNVTIFYNTSNSRGTVTTGYDGIALLKANVNNTLWYGDQMLFQVNAIGYMPFQQLSVFPGLPRYDTWELIQ